MQNNTISGESQPPATADGAGDVRAFVAVRLGGLSWVVDVVPNYELTVGTSHAADIRIDVPGVEAEHARLVWDGDQLTLRDAGHRARTLINDEPIDGAATIAPGDEVRIGPATLVVGITVTAVGPGRRSLTHQEFGERLNDELGRAARTGRPTALVMLKTHSGDGSRLAHAALNTFRAGDIVGTYAHDEIEFLLPDTPVGIAQAVVKRLLETAGGGQAVAGLAVSPDDGDSAERLMRAARDALAVAMQQRKEIGRPQQSVPPPAQPDAHSPATRLVVQDVTEAARTGKNVLLLGEPNSGKRYYARLLHERSPRAEGPFVLLHCPALLDAEAVTHAFGPKDSPGADCTAAEAVGGTLLVDEVGDLPMEGQRRLLSVLRHHEGKIGVVATTHRDLDALVRHHAFLGELQARLTEVRIGIPALRFRAESIVPLAKNFAKEYRPDAPVKLSAGAIEHMRTYAWPGNVLELRNAMERAVHLADGGEILAEHLPGNMPTTGDGRLRQHVGSVERDAIVKALADNNYNQTHAAKSLGISRRALIYKMEKYGLKPPPQHGGVSTDEEE